MRLFGQEFGAGTVERIRDSITADEGLTRSGLSRQVCEWLNWRAPSGALREMSCRKALLKLHACGEIGLPISRGRPGEGTCGQARTDASAAATQVRGSLAELGWVELVPVEAKSAQSRQWREMFDGYHPLNSGPLCGAQQRYLIRCQHFGWLGGLAFSAPAWHLAARDEHIGWAANTRSRNLTKVVANSRFLILPTVKVPHLASHVLGMATRRIEAGWLQRYGYAPVLLETFVDETQYAGACYRAANWQRLGETRGRGRNDHSGTAEIGRKGVYIYPLCADWRAQLCAPPSSGFCLPETVHDDDANDWAADEFGRVAFADGRLGQRLQGLARDFYARPVAPINQACNGDEGKIKGAYRFFNNPQVDMDRLLKPHIEATARRIQDEAVVLAVQDTTSLNYTTHRAMAGIGPINTRADGAQGLKLHDTLAFTPDGVPLGVLHIACWARDAQDRRSAKERKALPIEDKESERWLKSYRRVSEIQVLCPDTRLVSVGDREADIYELFQEAANTPNGPDLLVRANRSCQRKITEEHFLWAHLESQPIAGGLELYIPGKGGKKARTAVLDIRHAEVDIKPPKRLKGSDPMTLWAIYAHEPNPPTGTESVEWLLLTTVETTDLDQACERLSWYATRWNIEVYHRVLKSGCRIEDRRLGSAETLQACLAIDLVVAWRIFRLTKLGRTVPDVCCEIFFREEEWKALCIHYTKNPHPPETPPTLNEAIRIMAKLGGFIGRKGDGQPGTTSLWRGIQRLDDITETFRIMSSAMAAAP
jgi:Druantia protein DruA/Transposase Tn5 dimerisation domain/Transposase DNA-binding